MKPILWFDDQLEKLSRWGLVLSLFLILGLSVVAIVLRWMGLSFMWIEPLTRHLVFLSAFLGGSLATSKGAHIRIDLVTKLIESSRFKNLKWIHRNAVALFCFFVSLWLLRSGWDFYLMEKEFGAPAFLDLHSSLLVGIIPFGMGLIALRFFNQLLLSLRGGEAS